MHPVLAQPSSSFVSVPCLQVSKLIVLDPQKRLSVREALQHPWVLGKAARFSHMDTAQRKLQEFNARRKLKVKMLVRVETCDLSIPPEKNLTSDLSYDPQKHLLAPPVEVSSRTPVRLK